MKKIIFTAALFLLLFISFTNKTYAIEINAPTSASKGEEINVSISEIDRSWWIMVELLDSAGRQTDNREFEGVTSTQIKLTMPTTGFSPAILRVCRRLGSLPFGACDDPNRMELLKTQPIEIVGATPSAITINAPNSALYGEKINVQIFGLRTDWKVIAQIESSDGVLGDRKTFENITSIFFQMKTPSNGGSPARLEVCYKKVDLAWICGGAGTETLGVKFISLIAPSPTSTPTSTAFDPSCTTTKGERGVFTALGCIATDNLSGFASDILGKVIFVASGIAFLLMAFGAIQILTSAGSPEKMKAGSELITSALSGLIFIILSVFLLKLIGVDILQLPGFGST